VSAVFVATLVETLASLNGIGIGRNASTAESMSAA
jgi:hypothetical protein